MSVRSPKRYSQTEGDNEQTADGRCEEHAAIFKTSLIN